MVPATNENSSVQELLVITGETKNSGSTQKTNKNETFASKLIKANYLKGIRFKRKYRKILRRIKKRLLDVSNAIKEQTLKLWHSLKDSIVDAADEFRLIFKRAGDKYKKNKTDVLNKRRSGIISGMIIGSFVVGEVIKFIVKFFLFLLSYLAPVAAAVMLTFTVKYYLDMDYGIEVTLNGENLGYIKDESVYQTAEKDMQQRIYLEGEEPLYTTPTFSVAVVSDEELLTTNQMANKIVQASAEDISPAAGLYIDGAFYGATRDGEKLQQTIGDILNSYRLGGIDEEISFVQNIEVKNDGLYLNQTIKETEELTSVFYEEVESKRVYVVEEGDSPSFIANSNGITTDELVVLNPGIDQELQIGQELLLNQSKPLMSIRRSVTEVSEEAIAYEEERIANTTKPIGFAQVTQEGENGLAEVSRRVTYVDGVKSEVNETNRVTIKEAINEQTVLGTRDSRTGTNISLEELDAVKASGVFTWPVQSTGKITCGWLGYSGHYAIDIQSFLGDGTLAADDGVVVQVTYSNVGYGYHVVIDHLNGYRTLYAHHSKIYVEEGQTVKRGQVIAAQGRTGNVYGRTGIHLHFEIIKNGVKVNPLNYLVR